MIYHYIDIIQTACELTIIVNCSQLLATRVNNRLLTLSGRTGSALVWHSEGRTFAADSVQQVLWFAAQPALQCAIRGAQGLSLCRVGGATSQLDLPSLTPVSWLTATRSSPLGYFSKLLQVVDNWFTPHSVVVDSPLGGSWRLLPLYLYGRVQPRPLTVQAARVYYAVRSIN